MYILKLLGLVNATESGLFEWKTAPGPTTVKTQQQFSPPEVNSVQDTQVQLY